MIRQGASRLIAEAIEAELQEQFLNVAKAGPDGKATVVRNGYLPERDVLTGVGPVTVKAPKIRDRTGNGIKFTSKLVPPYLKRVGIVEEFLPLLYLRGVSTGDFSEALSALVGDKAKGLSPSTISR